MGGLRFDDKSDYDGKKVDWIGLDEEGNWLSADRIAKRWKVKPPAPVGLFKSNRHCGNCFWLTQYNHTCQYFKTQPDILHSCMFFESKENAKRIIQAYLGSKSVEP